MSRVSEVIKAKNKRKKQREARRKDELDKLKMKAAYRARLVAALDHVDVLLDSEDIDCVKIEVPQDYIARFSDELYKETLAEYEITQDSQNPLGFYIKKKYVAL